MSKIRFLVPVPLPPLHRADIAEAVDAADGVMDGRFYGRPIVRSAADYCADYFRAIAPF